MTIEIQKSNNYLAIFPNFKAVVDELPYKKRARAWQVIIDFAFGENIDLSKEDIMTRMAINSIIPLIKLRKISGVKQGTINNPRGKNGKYLANNGDNNKDNINQNNKDNNDDNPFIKENKVKENNIYINQDGLQLDNQDDYQDDYQDGIKSKSSPLISNKDISNITNDNKCYQMLSNDNKNNNKIKENKRKENNIKEKKIKEKKPSIQFLRLGEFKNVCLTNDDYERLKSTNTELDKAIERLDGWLETSNGSKNKNRNHRGYFKTNSWVWEKTGNQVIKPLILDLDEMLKVSEEERKGWTKEQWDKYYEEFEKRGGE